MQPLNNTAPALELQSLQRNHLTFDNAAAPLPSRQRIIQVINLIAPLEGQENQESPASLN